jgi:hypothetical protein
MIWVTVHNIYVSAHLEHLTMYHDIDIVLWCNKGAVISEFDTFLTEICCKLWRHSNDCNVTDHWEAYKTFSEFQQVTDHNPNIMQYIRRRFNLDYFQFGELGRHLFFTKTISSFFSVLAFWKLWCLIERCKFLNGNHANLICGDQIKVFQTMIW